MANMPELDVVLKEAMNGSVEAITNMSNNITSFDDVRAAFNITVTLLQHLPVFIDFCERVLNQTERAMNHSVMALNATNVALEHARGITLMTIPLHPDPARLESWTTWLTSWLYTVQPVAPLTQQLWFWTYHILPALLASLGYFGRERFKWWRHHSGENSGYTDREQSEKVKETIAAIEKETKRTKNLIESIKNLTERKDKQMRLLVEVASQMEEEVNGFAAQEGCSCMEFCQREQVLRKYLDRLWALIRELEGAVEVEVDGKEAGEDVE